MKLTPVTSPLAIQPSGTPEATRTAKAVAAFKAGASSYDTPVVAAPTQGQAQETPVANPNNISAEELSAVKGRTLESQSTEMTEEISEVKAQETKVEPEKPMSQEWAKLARQEKALRAKAQQQDQAFKQREAALQAKEAEAAQKSEINQKGFISLDSIKNDPLGILEKAGITYDELANQMLNPVKTDPRTQSMLNQLQAKIEALEKATEEGSKRQTEQQQNAYNAAVKQIEADARQLVKSDPDTYEAISKTNSIKDVVELITETYNKEGVLMTVEEAALEVENYLISEAEKLSNLKKIQSKRSASQVQAVPAKMQQPSSKEPQASIKTLTNAVSSTRKLGARERALLAFKGELGSR